MGPPHPLQLGSSGSAAGAGGQGRGVALLQGSGACSVLEDGPAVDRVCSRSHHLLRGREWGRRLTDPGLGAGPAESIQT